MYVLILIVMSIAGGTSVDIDKIEFDDKTSCLVARGEIIDSVRRMQPLSGSIYIEAECVAK